VERCGLVPVILSVQYAPCEDKTTEAGPNKGTSTIVSLRVLHSVSLSVSL